MRVRYLHRWQSHEEKETDVNIASYLIHRAYQDAFDRALSARACCEKFQWGCVCSLPYRIFIVSRALISKDSSCGMHHAASVFSATPYLRF